MTVALDASTRQDPLLAAYLDGRDVRWRAVFERRLRAAGTNPRARLLALFEALRICTREPDLAGCTFAGVSAAGPFSRQVIRRHETTLGDRMAELAAEAGAPVALAGQLLVLFRTAALLHASGTRPAAVDEAARTAARLVGSCLTTRDEHTHASTCGPPASPTEPTSPRATAGAAPTSTGA